MLSCGSEKQTINIQSQRTSPVVLARHLVFSGLLQLLGMGIKLNYTSINTETPRKQLHLTRILFKKHFGRYIKKRLEVQVFV
jgi:hypothetical protein